jgi:hypothetical protein
MADFMNFPTRREHVLTCGNTTIGVIPEICLITHFQVGPWSVLYRPMQTGNVKRWGLPLMIPNFSRLNHGTNENMPIAPGFHPYFSVAQAEKKNVTADGLPEFDAAAFDWVNHIPDNPYPFPHQVTVQFPGSGTLIIAEVPQNGQYALANMQVWSEPPTKPDHDFICFEPTVSSEDALNRPADRLNVEQQSSQQIVLQLRAMPL